MMIPEENNFIVYMHTAPNGKKYIGITCRGIVARWGRCGARYLEKNKGGDYKYFGKAILKYGWENFKHEILFTDLSKEEACKKEIELISKYKTTNPMYGYNSMSGGEHHKPNKETLVLLSKRSMGRKKSEEERKKISENNKGKKLSEETKKKISETKKSQKLKWTQERRDNVRKLHEEQSDKIPDCFKKGHSFSQEVIEKMRIAKIGKHPSEETRKKLSIAHKKSWAKRKGVENVVY